MVGGDDPHGQCTDPGQERAVVEAGQHRWPARRAHPDQELGAGAGELGEERGAVEAAVGQDQYVGSEPGQQAARVVGLPGRGRSNTAPSRARVPVSTRVISSTAGYPVTPSAARILPSQHRFGPVSGGRAP